MFQESYLLNYLYGMKLLNYLKNLFTGFRPYSFIQKRLWARQQQLNNLHSQRKPHRKFMTKHRYTHTAHNWNIGNTHKK